MFDDFYGPSSTSGEITGFGWAVNGGTITLKAPEDNSPGIGMLRNASAAAISTLYTGSPANGFAFILGDLKTIIFRSAFTTGASVPDKRVGLMMSAVNSAPADDGVYFECLAADTNWFAVTRDGATTNHTRTDTGIAFSANTFLTFRIEHTAPSTWAFYINDVLKATHGAAQNPPAEAQGVFIFGQVVTTGTANMDQMHDYVAFRVNPVR
jgi:hypothetical protein